MTSPKTLLKAWGIRPRKSMGQNFLTSPETASTIISRAGLTGEDTVVEIGSGLGALTVPLAYQSKHVYAIEPDKRIAGLLRNELMANGLTNVTIVENDILACDLSAMTDPSLQSLKVLGNLPYHISSQVIVYLLGFRKYITSAILMFQKEVAERLLAQPGNKIYGRLSVLIGYSATIRPVITVPASSFHPRSGVDSAVVAIDFFNSPLFPASDETLLFNIVRTGFGKRRKMLKNALLTGDLNLNEFVLMKAFKSADIDPQTRAEKLSVEEFVRLSNALSNNSTLLCDQFD